MRADEAGAAGDEEPHGRPESSQGVESLGRHAWHHARRWAPDRGCGRSPGPSRKQLMPVYDKPMIYYPLSTLIMAGIREVLVITTPEDQAAVPAAARRRQPVRACASSTPRSRGPRASRRRSSSAPTSSATTAVALVLGDNIFHGVGPGPAARHNAEPSRAGGSSPTRWPTRRTYGVVEFDDDGRVLSIEEKPAEPEVPLRRAGPVLLRQPGGRDRPRPASPAPAASWRSPRSTTAYLRARRAAR